jgi:phosphoglycolate phosphatase-like HAD superfamily hydrolase
VNALRALIFDFDGVILDSNALKTAAFREVFARYPQHADAMMAYHEANVSQSRYEKFTYLVEQLLGRSGDRQLVNRLADDFADLLRNRMDVCPVVPGARELLDAASARVPLYLASVTPEEELLRLLDAHRLRHYFRRVYGCPPWTKPDAVGAIVSEVGGADDVALIGDSSGDQRAAAVHGVEFIPRDSGLCFDPPVAAHADVAVIASALLPRLSA